MWVESSGLAISPLMQRIAHARLRTESILREEKIDMSGKLFSFGWKRYGSSVGFEPISKSLRPEFNHILSFQPPAPQHVMVKSTPLGAGRPVDEQLRASLPP